MSMIGVGRGVKQQAKAGFSTAADGESARNRINDNIDQAKKAEKKQTIGTLGGMGLQYAMKKGAVDTATAAATNAATTTAATTAATAAGTTAATTAAGTTAAAGVAGTGVAAGGAAAGATALAAAAPWALGIMMLASLF